MPRRLPKRPTRGAHPGRPAARTRRDGPPRRLERHRRRHATISRVRRPRPRTIPGNVGRPPRLVETRGTRRRGDEPRRTPGDESSPRVRRTRHPRRHSRGRDRRPRARVRVRGVPHRDASQRRAERQFSRPRRLASDGTGRPAADDATHRFRVRVRRSSRVRRRQPFRRIRRVRVRLVETPERATAREILRRLRRSGDCRRHRRRAGERINLRRGRRL